MRKTSLSILFLLALAGSGLAQDPCGLTANDLPTLRGLKVGSSLTAIEKDFKFGKTRVYDYFGPHKSGRVTIDNIDFQLTFADERMISISARHPRRSFPDIYQFTASITFDLNLPTVWVLPTREQLDAAKYLLKIVYEIGVVEDDIRYHEKLHGSEHVKVKELYARLAVLKKDRDKTKPLATETASMKCKDFTLFANVPLATEQPTLLVRLANP